jgi:ABC-type branched-subunit amino acid transport system substrate-binding protein
MGAALKAIEDVCAAGGDPTNRQAVRDAVFAIKDYDGALGKWSFDANGDITLLWYVIGKVTGGQFVEFGSFLP